MSCEYGMFDFEYLEGHPPARPNEVLPIISMSADTDYKVVGEGITEGEAKSFPVLTSSPREAVKLEGFGVRLIDLN